MPLTELIDTFKHLRTQIETHGDYLRLEARTRPVLIDPLLEALGWDVEDPYRVQVEYPIEKQYEVGRGFADYVLMRDGKPLAVIEAKPLRSNLIDKATNQVLNYANARGIAYMVVSDGNTWRVFDVFMPVQLEDKIVTEFTISEQPAGTCAVKSLAMWNPNLASAGGPVPGQDPVFVVDDDNPNNGGDDNGGDDPPPRPPGVGLDELSYRKGKMRGALRFPDSSSVEVKNWKGLYVEVAKYLVRKRFLTADLAPFGFKEGTRYAVAATPYHSNRTQFHDAREIGDGLIVEGYVGSGEGTLDFTKLLIEKCGLNPRDFGIELDT